MDCPICLSAMKPIPYEGCPIHTCDSCGGEFVAGESLAAIVRTRHEKFPAALLAQVQTQQPEFGVFCEARGLGCPACENPMRSMNYTGDTGVCIDRCELCNGIWLDREELEKVQVLLEQWQDRAPILLRPVAGKLEEARAKAAAKAGNAFRASRFSFVNAVINRLLDAA